MVEKVGKNSPSTRHTRGAMKVCRMGMVDMHFSILIILMHYSDSSTMAAPTYQLGFISS